eukprot:GILJ01001134.1.p1 GENE.GILJ01001134.1~~GILJ01001134.1.p1  ORF type:complete len:448 (-),score=72.26 GILJ01001134.1:353-1696(-)
MAMTDAYSAFEGFPIDNYLSSVDEVAQIPNMSPLVIDDNLSPEVLLRMLLQVLATGSVSGFDITVNTPEGHHYAPDPLDIRFTRNQWRRANDVGQQQNADPLFSSLTADYFFDAFDEHKHGHVSFRDFHQSLVVLSQPPSEATGLFTFRFLGGEHDFLHRTVATHRGLAVVSRLSASNVRAHPGHVMDCFNHLFARNSQVPISMFVSSFFSLPQLFTCFNLFNLISRMCVKQEPVRNETYLPLTQAAMMPVVPSASPVFDRQLSSSSSPVSPVPDVALLRPLTPATVPPTPSSSRRKTTMSTKRKRDKSCTKEDYPPRKVQAFEREGTASPVSCGDSDYKCPHKGNDECQCKHCIRVRRNRASAREAQRKKKEALDAIGPLRTQLEESTSLLTAQSQEVTRLQKLVQQLQSENIALYNECYMYKQQVQQQQIQQTSSTATTNGCSRY